MATLQPPEDHATLDDCPTSDLTPDLSPSPSVLTQHPSGRVPPGRSSVSGLQRLSSSLVVKPMLFTSRPHAPACVTDSSLAPGPPRSLQSVTLPWGHLRPCWPPHCSFNGPGTRSLCTSCPRYLALFPR
uniref:Uncharacterized protein n=1 Tax=Molossus molossus TaxID=27622 RepID=A0A7J8CRU3_MOLMO|nr:hypothetical protein HJG59_009813 [Molossus molossus]